MNSRILQIVQQIRRSKVVRYSCFSGLLASLLWVVGCFKVPEKPKWDIPFTMPFSEKTYTLSDMLKVNVTTSSQVVRDSLLRGVRQSDGNGFYGMNDTLVFFVAGKIEPKSFFDKLSSDPQTPKLFRYTIDTLMLDSLRCGEVDYTPARLGIATGTYPSFPTVRSDVQSTYDRSGSNFVYFNYLLWGTGRMVAIVKNSFPTSLDSVRFSLLDPTNRVIGVSDLVLSIPPGTTDTVNMNIPSGARIDSLMIVRASSVIRGSSSQVVITDTSRINVKLVTNRIRVTEARAVIPQQYARADTSLATGIADSIISAEVRKGKLYLTLTNRMGVTIDSLKLVFRDFFLPNNTNLIWPPTGRSVVLAPNVPHPDSIDLAGVRIVMADTSSQKFHTTGFAYTHAVTAPNMVTIRGTDGLDMSYNLGKAYFSRFVGVPDSMVFDFDSTTTNVENRPSGVQNLGLTYAELVVSPKSTISNLPVLMDYHLLAENPSGTRVPFDALDQLFPDLNRVTRIPGTQNVLNIVPSKIISTGRVKIGKHFLPSTGVIRVSESDSLTGFATIEGPMMFRLLPQQMIPDPEKREGQDRPIDKIEFRVMGENHLPVGGRVQIQLSTDSMNWVTAGGASVAQPSFNRTTHRPIGYTSFDTTLVFKDSIVQYFKKPIFYTRAILDLQGTGTDTVYCKISDYIKLRTAAKITVNTGEVQ